MQHHRITCEYDGCRWAIRLSIENPLNAVDQLRVVLREHADEQRHHGPVPGRWHSLDGDATEGEVIV